MIRSPNPELLPSATPDELAALARYVRIKSHNAAHDRTLEWHDVHLVALDDDSIPLNVGDVCDSLTEAHELSLELAKIVVEIQREARAK